MHAKDLPSGPGKTAIPTNMWDDGSVQQPIEQAGPSNYGDQMSIKAFSGILTMILIVSSGGQSFTIPDSNSGEQDLYPGIPVLTYNFTFHLMKISFQTSGKCGAHDMPR